jgi:hypothetical protein
VMSPVGLYKIEVTYCRNVSKEQDEVGTGVNKSYLALVPSRHTGSQNTILNTARGKMVQNSVIGVV